jgi:SOS-response transcriptional repressor LexA|tara:strand:- start:542 stop:799 length:258 start_codon:yes stop_codon:yes gene_type:complete
MKKTKSKRPMTPKMLKLLQYIRNYSTKYGYSPTFTEMCQELGYKSKNSVSSLIKKLEERNELKRDYVGYSRNIILNEKSRKNISV